MHSKEHHAFHISAQQHGMNPESLEKVTGIVLKGLEKVFSKKLNLLVTVGLEHYTAVLVVSMMETVNEYMTDKTIRDLWLWHSVEETEHKAVAFDLYEYLYGNGLNAYLPRVTIFTLSLILITGLSTIYQIVLMKRDKQLSNLKTWQNFFNFAAKQYKTFIPKFFEYYRYDFHPNQTNEKNLVATTKIKLGIKDTPALVS